MNRRRTILLAVAMTVLALTSSTKAQTIERIRPVEESFSMPTHGVEQFQARFSGLPWSWFWIQAQWYVDGELKKTEPMSGNTDTSSFERRFYTPGTHEVKVRAQYFPGAWTDDLTWTVEVYAHPPSGSRVSPGSPVTVYEGDTQAFTVLATDRG